MLIFPLITGQAQTHFSQMGYRSNHLRYLSPKNGDTYVPQATTIILKTTHQKNARHSASDFNFIVSGSISGLHPGAVILSDDSETVIFKPESAFTCGEGVNIALVISGEATFSQTNFSFQISPITESERSKRYQSWMDATQVFEREKISAHYANDNYTFRIDTIIPSKVAAGDIFTTRNDSKSYVECLDNSAHIVYEHEVFNPPSENFRPWNNNSFAYCYQGRAYILDSNHTEVDQVQCGNGYHTDDHEFVLLPNGHSFVMAYDDRDTDMRTVTGDPNAATSAVVVGSIIQELDRNKNVVFQWRSWDHFDIKDAQHVNLIKPNPRFIEYSHLNCIDIDADGNIIASFRAMSEVTKIDRITGDLIWRWGGKNNQFTFIGDTIPFSYQHEVRRIAGGNITMFDNGLYRSAVSGDGTSYDTAWTRVIEYELNEEQHTAKAVWQYRDLAFTPSAGSAQRLPNGNTLICAGGFGVQKIIEISNGGERVFQMRFPDGGFSYRAYRFPQPTAMLAVGAERMENKSSLSLLIHPNPASTESMLTLMTASSSPVQFDLLDLMGRTVVNEILFPNDDHSCTIRLDLHSLVAGIYFCKITQGSNSLTKELVIQK
ncbi:MAG: aryl-sulfate sulfotransferase [Ignavibacteriota bacterium]